MLCGCFLENFLLSNASSDLFEISRHPSQTSNNTHLLPDIFRKRSGKKNSATTLYCFDVYGNCRKVWLCQCFQKQLEEGRATAQFRWNRIRNEKLKVRMCAIRFESKLIVGVAISFAAPSNSRNIFRDLLENKPFFVVSANYFFSFSLLQGLSRSCIRCEPSNAAGEFQFGRNHPKTEEHHRPWVT